MTHGVPSTCRLSSTGLFSHGPKLKPKNLKIKEIYKNSRTPPLLKIPKALFWLAFCKRNINLQRQVK